MKRLLDDICQSLCSFDLPCLIYTHKRISALFEAIAQALPIPPGSHVIDISVFVSSRMKSMMKFFLVMRREA